MKLCQRPPNVGRRDGFATYRDIEPDYFGNIEPDFFSYDGGAGGSWPLWAFYKARGEFNRRGLMADITVWGNINMYERLSRLQSLNNKVRELYGKTVS